MNTDIERLNFDIEKHARERWWHEDHLVNQRTTWLLTTQGLLSGGFGFLRYRISEITDGNPFRTLVLNKQDYVSTLDRLSTSLFSIGFVSFLVSLAGIHAAVLAQQKLAEQYPYVLGVSKQTTRTGQFVARSTPSLCALAWLVAFVMFRLPVR